MCSVDFSFVCSHVSPSLPFLSPQKTMCHQSEEVRIDLEQELGAGHELCQTGKDEREGREEGRGGGSSLTCQMFMWDQKEHLVTKTGFQ